MSAANRLNFRLCDHKLRLFWLVALLCCLSSRWCAATPMGMALTQRRINELAAALQRARLALIEDTGLRAPQEPLPTYFARIVLEQTGSEPFTAYRARVQGYLDALVRAAENTASAQQAPVLRHNDADNLERWRRATRALNQMPVHIARARFVWKRVLLLSGQSSTKVNNLVDLDRRLGSELTQSMELLLVAYNALRDARP